VAGKSFIEIGEKSLSWKSTEAGTSFSTNFSTSYAVYWQAFYIQANRFTELKLKAESGHPFEVFVDRVKKASNYSFTDKPVTRTASLKLQMGKYLVVVKSLIKKEEKQSLPVKIDLTYGKEFTSDAVALSLSDEQFMDIPHLLLGQRLTSISLSSDGSLAMLHFSETFPPKGQTDRWFVIKNVKSGEILFSSKHSRRSEAEWVPGKQQISYVTKNGVSSFLMLYDLKSHKERVLMKTSNQFSGYDWSPKGSFIIYSVREKYEKNKTGVYELRGMSDRWPWYRNRTQLYMYRLSDHSKKQLTYGYLTNNLQDISQDETHMLFSQSYPYYAKRPYTKQVMMQMNLNNGRVDTLWNASFGGSAVYSPNGKQLLVTGSPAMFNGAGIHLKKAKIPNDFDIQAYIYTLATKKVEPVTKNFQPAINNAWWNPVDHQIYFLTQDRTYVNIWRYNPANHKIKLLPMKVDVVTDVSFAGNAPFMSYSGSSISYPATGWLFNLKENKQVEISNPEKAFFAHIKFGKTEDWNFKNKNGLTIDGRIYYPPDYDPNKKYPLLVYYYGGTVPTSRDFGGRYPKNLFAAMGYIVYDLQPSGATGYGQDFSALHVNGWGKENASDIIEGTKKFLKAHPEVNPKFVGCMGASYGGYMTMWLQTQTDIFTTAIAHAGISDITSYWGQGYWGYLYSSVASANSFPWNNKKLYVDHSPLFNAEKIHTPLLLIQGTADTNVPTGESIQLYTALKLLGRPVKLVEVKGQNHHIIDYNKRILWQKTIFAWMAKYLKDQPQWWNEMYPKKDL
jgi:dipeptidyl aminopeptidase/acylaminoacyl peptidase